MKEKFMEFMYGRYGVDAFGKFTIICTLVVMFLASVTHSWVGILFTLISWLLIGYSYYRMMSRDISKRSSENQIYLDYQYKFKIIASRFIRNMKIRKTHHIYKCPTCKQKIRIPRGKGRIEIRCPKCHTKFIKHS